MIVFRKRLLGPGEIIPTHKNQKAGAAVGCRVVLVGSNWPRSFKTTQLNPIFDVYKVLRHRKIRCFNDQKICRTVERWRVSRLEAGASKSVRM